MASLAHLLSSRDRVFYDLFESFAATVVKATEHLEELLAHYPDRREELFRQIRDFGRQGDETRHAEATARTSSRSPRP